MSAECLIFVEGEDAPYVFFDINLAADYAIDLVKMEKSFDVIPTAKAGGKRHFIVRGREIDEIIEIADNDMDIFLQGIRNTLGVLRTRFHWNAEENCLGPLCYNSKYLQYFGDMKLAQYRIHRCQFGELPVILDIPLFTRPRPILVVNN